MITLKDKKGFLFVVTIFLLLTYILISISVWVKALEASERMYSELYKESNVELAVTQLTPEKVDEMTNMIMQRALFKIADFSINHPVVPGNTSRGENEFVNIENAVEEYLVNGAPSGAYFEGIADDTPAFSEPSSSLQGWIAALNKSLGGIGVYITEFDVSNFNMEQISVDTVEYSFDITITMQDTAGTTRLSRVYPISNTIDITGYVDVAISRETQDERTVYRRFFFYPGYEIPSDLEPVEISGIEGGQGWFYGFLVDTEDADIVPREQRHLYILVGDYSEITAVDGYSEFAAYIQTNDASTRTVSCTPSGGTPTTKREEYDTFMAIQYESDCDAVVESSSETNRPFAIVPDFSASGGAVCPNLVTDEDAYCALFVAEYSVNDVEDDPENKNSADAALTGVFDIEDLRDYTMCGYYIHSEKSPSYLQRFFGDAYSRNHTEFGIETFLIGEYVTDYCPECNTFDFSQYSALDREMFNEVDKDWNIRGMAGCKNADMCSSTVEPTPGQFGLTEISIDDYVLDDIDCDGGAGCEE